MVRSDTGMCGGLQGRRSGVRRAERADDRGSAPRDRCGPRGRGCDTHRAARWSDLTPACAEVCKVDALVFGELNELMTAGRLRETGAVLAAAGATPTGLPDGPI